MNIGNKDELAQKLTEVLSKVWDKAQERPDQYVVAYYRVDNEELIGYHASTFCQLTDDILYAKRYAGDKPYEQLAVIAKNVKYVLDGENKGMFSSLVSHVRKQFEGLKSGDIYMDVIYLEEGTPKQPCRWRIITPDDASGDKVDVKRLE